jgi:hypothetical protein
MKKPREASQQTDESLARRRREDEQPQFDHAPPHLLTRLQRAAGNRAVVRLLESSALRTKSKEEGAGDEYERDADRAAAQALKLSPAPDGMDGQEGVLLKARGEPILSNAGARVQLAPRDNSSAATPAAERPEVSTSAGPLIVEDEAAELTTGQMRKSDFLAELRGAACAAADEALASAGRDTRGCPYIEQAFDSYAGRPAAYIERALRKYAPEAAGATSARDYIPAVSERVRRGVSVWAETGEVAGVPEELAGMMSGGALLGGMIGGAVSGLLGGIGAAVSGVVGAVGGALSGIGRALFKKKENAGASADNPQQIREQFGGGQPLDGSARSRMGAAFGMDFSHVRVHTDAQAAGLSDSLNARAFTIGNDIAFAGGEYQPGTMIGDALLAHELAHVVQQGGGNGRTKPLAKGESEESALDEEADHAAVGAVLTLWGGAVGVASAKPSAWTSLRSGLRLQRCGHEPGKPTTRYEFYLLEGMEKLKGIGFGVQWHEFCESQARKPDGTKWDGYDTDYWQKQADPVVGCKLVLRDKRTPAQAIKALFDPDRKDRWQVDCGQFVQLAHYYALLHTLIAEAGSDEKGSEQFNQRIGGPMELKQVISTGLKTRILWGRDDPASDEMQEFERVSGERHGQPKPNGRVRKVADVIKEAPMGSRVVFYAGRAIMRDERFQVENTMKVGDNLYAAHPLRQHILTGEEVIEEMASAADNPTMAKSQIFISEVEIYDVPGGAIPPT